MKVEIEAVAELQELSHDANAKRICVSLRLAVAAALDFSAFLGAVEAVGETPARPIRIGVLSDMSSLYANQAGLGSVEAARMAIEDAGGRIGDQPIELVSADHQHKSDVGTSSLRRWFDIDGVDVVVDMPISSVALAVQQVVRERA